MFGSKKNPEIMAESSQSGKTDTTIIGAGSSFDGKLFSSGIVRIDGSFNGELNLEGSLIIGESGSIRGNISAKKVTIAGKVEGNIRCDGSLELTPSGKLYGDIDVRNIIIEDGAVFQGKCKMIDAAPMLEPVEEEVKLLTEDKSPLSD